MKKTFIDLRVEMADLDGMRATYHANYLKWFDRTRTKLFMEAGVRMDQWEEGGILLPLVICNCEYKAGTRFNDPLRVSAEVKELGGKSITIEHRVENLDTGVLTTTGLVKIVFCDANGKPFNLEERYPDVYHALKADA